MSSPGVTSSHAATDSALSDLKMLVDRGRYADALALVRGARAAHGRNIFLIALEKQLEKFLSLPAGNGTPNPERTQVLASLPGLVDRALADLEANPVPTAPQKPSPASEEGKADRRAALDELKTQYFQHADDFIRKGDYKSALVEVKRVQIIDPGNKMAKQYEQKLKELKEVERHGPSGDQEDTSPTDSAPSTFSPPLSVPEPEPAAPPYEHAHEAPALPSRVLAQMQEEEKGSSKKMLYIAVAGVVVIAVVIFLMLPTRKSSQALPPAASNQTTNVQPSQTPLSTPEVSAKAEPSVQKKREEQKAAEPEQRSAKETAKNTSKREEAPAAEPAVKQEEPAPSAPAPASISPSSPMASNNASPVPRSSNESSPTPAAPMTGTEAPPHILKLEQPVYPSSAWDAGMEGQVTARVQVSPKGEPVQVKIIKSSNAVFNSAVIDAAKKSKFSPATMPTGPVTAWISMTFKFKHER